MCIVALTSYTYRTSVVYIQRERVCVFSRIRFVRGFGFEIVFEGDHGTGIGLIIAMAMMMIIILVVIIITDSQIDSGGY